jgi:DNA-binding IclR family transcriptional regulator
LDGQGSTSTSVTKAFSVLDALAHKPNGGASLSEISALVGMSRSTTHRYLTTLEKLGAVERDAGDRFRLGPHLIELAGAFLAGADLRTESMALLQELANRTQETIHLAVPSGSEIVYIGKVDSPQAIQMYSHIGARLPMHSTALGKSILPFVDADQIEMVIAAGLSARTPRTITSPSGLREELARVREQGFAIDDEENELGVRCVGAPIFDYRQTAIGAVSVSGPTSRMTRERAAKLGPVVREVAAGISRRMGAVREQGGTPM